MRHGNPIVSRVLLLAVSAMIAGAGIVNSEDAERPLPRVVEKLAGGKPVKIACLGDSVTGVYYHTGGRRAYPEMVPLALQQAYPAAKITLVNAGISGNSTLDALKRLQNDVLDHQPDLVTVMFGLNDMVRVPLTEYALNLKTIAEKCRGVGAEVLFCTPNAIIDSGDRSTDKLVDYCNAMKEAARQLKVPMCDCYAAHAALRERDPLAWRLMMSDAIHPNMDGHKLNAVSIGRSISGRELFLSAAAPPQPAIAKTLARLKSGEPIRVLAMGPYNELIEKALRAIEPAAQVEVTAWPTAGQSLAKIEEAAKTVRAKPHDLVLLAVPAAVTPSANQPSEAGISSYSWILNWSLSFGHQEWDVVAIAPSVQDPELSDAGKSAEAFTRKMVAAQDLSLIARAAADKSPAEQILENWTRAQKSASRD